MAEFLNTTFAGFDSAIFVAMNGLAVSAGGFFTPFFKIISLLGEKGIVFFALAIIMMLFKNTRKLGICMFGAVACGALLTNVILKDLIERPRPFLENTKYFEFWQTVSSPKEDGFSFPSGHMTAITAAATALFIFCNKKWSWVGFLGVILMGISRVYLVAHYMTDVLAGIFVGAISGVIAWAITKLIYSLLNKNLSVKFCSFILNFNVIDLFKKSKARKENSVENEQSTEEKE